jgi:uncharacterized protein YceH (UPF0502 family)
MPIQMTETELRVLGVLIEKSLSHPQSYPMTLNAVLLGANQKQNRDPVVEYSEREIAKALYDLEKRRLVKQTTPEHGARANRFAHNVVEELHWDRREQAIMAELMLRGRQTVGELRPRASRMTPLADLEAVMSILKGLQAHDPPFVEELVREPGRSTTRFRHLLSAEAGLPAGAAAAPPTKAAAGSPDEAPDTQVDRLAALEDRVSRLEGMVEELRKNVADPPAADRPV